MDLQEKVKLVILSRISFNNIEEVEQFLTDIFQKDDFAKKVKIIQKVKIEQYQSVYDFFLQNK